MMKSIDAYFLVSNSSTVNSDQSNGTNSKLNLHLRNCDIIIGIKKLTITPVESNNDRT